MIKADISFNYVHFTTVAKQVV